MDNMKLIDTKIVGAGGIASITFTAIPQTYTDLKIYASSRDNRAGQPNDDLAVRVGYNGTINTGSIYTFRRVWGNGGAAGSDSNSGTALFCGMSSGATSTANVFGSNELYFSNYTSNVAKSVLVDGASENNAGTAWQVFNQGSIATNDPITDIQIYGADATLLSENSTFYLYGISNITAGAGGAKATGGYVTEDTNYFYHTFLSSGTFTPTQSLTCDYLVIAGGGGAGYDGGGGGGAGGFRAFTSQSLSATAYAVTIGSGGAGSTSAGAKGSSGGTSTFNSNSSSGGGGGGSDASPAGNSGGSGGGGRLNRAGNTGGTGNSGGYSPAEGNAGGDGSSGGTASGGGGGAGASGNAGTTGDGGNGTNSYSSWAIATATGDRGYYAGGGGGIGPTGVPSNGGLGGGAGGLGGGTAGMTARNGIANTGGGGGGNSGSGNVFTGGNGGSGLVIVRYAK